MKKKHLLVSIIFLAGLLLASCSDDNDNNDDNGTTPEPEELVKNADGYYGDIRSVKTYKVIASLTTLADGTYKLEKDEELEPILVNEKKYNEAGKRIFDKESTDNDDPNLGETVRVSVTNTYDEKGRLIKYESETLRMDNKNEFTKYHQHFVNTYEINEAQKTITEEKFVNKEDGDNYELDDLPYQACIRTYKDQELSILESEKYYVQKAIIEEEEADGTRAGIAAAKALTVTDNKIITKNDQRNNPLISYLLASKTGDDPKKVKYELHEGFYYLYVYEYADGTQSKETTESTQEEAVEKMYIGKKPIDLGVNGDIKYFEKNEYQAQTTRLSIEEFKEEEIHERDLYTFGDDGYLSKHQKYTWKPGEIPGKSRLYYEDIFKTDAKGRTTLYQRTSNLSQPELLQDMIRYVIAYDDDAKTATVQLFRKDTNTTEEYLSSTTIHGQTKDNGYVNSYVIISENTTRALVRSQMNKDIDYEEDLDFYLDRKYVTKYNSLNNKEYEYTYTEYANQSKGIGLAYKWKYELR